MSRLTFTSSVTITKPQFWLDPVRLQNSGGFGRNEINRVQKLIEENRERLRRSWDEYFND